MMSTTMTHPDTVMDYCEPVLAGEAAPTVYHSLMEAAIRDGVAPDRLLTAWCLRQLIWDVVSLFGAILLLFGLWAAGILWMITAVWASIKHLRPLNVRLGYCAIYDYSLATWAVQRGYLSLIPIAEQNRAQWRDRNIALLARARSDLHEAPARTAMVLNLVAGPVLLVARGTVGVLLVVQAVRDPGLLTISIGAVVGGFFVLQFVTRCHLLLGRHIAARRGNIR